jgi:hypothetical protein
MLACGPMDDRPPLEHLTDDEFVALVGKALETNVGRALQGTWLQSIVLKRWWADFSGEELLEARREAPDSGMEAAQQALDAMPPEERSELLNRAIGLFRSACAEAAAQLEHEALGLWEDPRQIDAELVATVAGLPVVARGKRLLGELDDPSAD